MSKNYPHDIFNLTKINKVKEFEKWKKLIIKFHFLVKLYEIPKKYTIYIYIQYTIYNQSFLTYNQSLLNENQMLLND